MSHQYEESNYQKEEVDSLKLLLFRVLNKNQLVILSEIPKNTSMSISSLLRNIEKNFRIPLSTLKLNAKILKEIGLIEFGDSNPVRLTKGGMFVNKILNNPKDSNLFRNSKSNIK
ncbi:MAG TPA: hypothetical protein ENF38_01330 [Candidatus Aenigmarchaeota archaeon]|nr:hypothetical protein [Candidatus Aenigmarchaeota archaeon]